LPRVRQRKSRISHLRRPPRIRCLAGGRVLSPGGVSSTKQKSRSDEIAAALKRAPVIGSFISCCPLRRRSPVCGRPNVPMTVRDLVQRDWERPSSVPERGRVPEQAWVREPALVQPSVQQAWVQRASVLQTWVPRTWVPPPSFWRRSFWRWPFWLIFSALPPWTSWRISWPSWPFSPTSSKISSRLFSSPLQAFYSF
jgi:hypothetical protein